MQRTAAADPSEVRSTATSITLPFRSLQPALTANGVSFAVSPPPQMLLLDLLQILTSLPSDLAAASDRDVLHVAASSVASLYPSLGYIR